MPGLGIEVPDVDDLRSDRAGYERQHHLLSVAVVDQRDVLVGLSRGFGGRALGIHR